MDYIKILIETNNLDCFELWISKFLSVLSPEEIIDKEFIKCFWLLLEEFDMLNSLSI